MGFENLSGLLWRIIEEEAKRTLSELLQDDQTKNISCDESDFFPVISECIRCNIVKFDFPRHSTIF